MSVWDPGVWGPGVWDPSVWDGLADAEAAFSGQIPPLNLAADVAVTYARHEVAFNATIPPQHLAAAVASGVRISEVQFAGTIPMQRLAVPATGRPPYRVTLSVSSAATPGPSVQSAASTLTVSDA